MSVCIRKWASRRSVLGWINVQAGAEVIAACVPFKNLHICVCIETRAVSIVLRHWLVNIGEID